MAITLAVVDSADGTGAVATVAGAGAAATVTLYRHTWAGSTGSHAPTSAGSRTGSGTITASAAVGLYWWLAVSVNLDGTAEFSPLVYQNVTDADEQAVHYQILEAVKTRIVSLNLTGLTSAKVLRQWVPRAWEGIDDPPVCLVAPVGQEDTPPQMGVTDLDDVGYPVGVILIDVLNQDASRNMNRDLLWRQRLHKAFRHQHLQEVSATYFCDINPGVIIDPDAWRMGYLVSVTVLRFVNRQSRGMG